MFDAVLNTYTQINDDSFNLPLDANEYPNRFFITFEAEDTLSTNSNTIDSIRIYYLNDTEEIYINWVNTHNIKEVQLINLLGQSVKVWNEIEPINQREIRIPVENISDGSYIINVKSKDGKSSNKKVIIRL